MKRITKCDVEVEILCTECGSMFYSTPYAADLWNMSLKEYLDKDLKASKWEVVKGAVVCNYCLGGKNGNRI